ncbi:MAG: helix-turn-helix domain-containing protein [Nitrospira sp.]|nr:helix-turn-helix domain-containing protein [Nitrospira sp.]
MKQQVLTKRLYSLAETAMYLGRSIWSVRRLIWNGELPQVRAGGRVHVDVRDLDAFIEKNKVREESPQYAQRQFDMKEFHALSNKIT